MNKSLQCILVAKKANSILGCIRQSCAREVMLPLFSAQERHSCSAVLSWAPQDKRDMGIVEQSSERP